MDNKNIDFIIFQSKECSEGAFYSLSDNENELEVNNENYDSSFIFNRKEEEYYRDDKYSFKMNFDDLMKRNEMKKELSNYSYKFKRKKN